MKRNSGLQKRWLRNTLSILFAIAVPSLLGYIHLSVKPVRSDKITIKLKGAAKEADAFKQIVEVVEPSAGDLDLLRAKNGEKTNNELRIVEVEFLETINR